jgi:hypothetical protein
VTEAAELALEARRTALLDAFGHFVREAVPRLAPGALADHLGDLEQEARIRLLRALESQGTAADPAAAVARLSATALVEAARRITSRWAPRPQADCPPADTLAVAALGLALDAGVKGTLEAHAACPECAQEKALAAAAGAWSRDVAAGLFTRAASAAAPPARERRPPRRVPLPVVVALGVVCAVLAIYAAIQRSSNRRLLSEFQAAATGGIARTRPPAGGPAAASPPAAAPIANVPLVELRPLRSAPETGRTELDLSAPVMLLLQAPGVATRRLRVRAVDGTIAWEGEMARRDAAGPATLLLPAGALVGGEYRLDCLDGDGRPAPQYYVRVK